MPTSLLQRIEAFPAPAWSRRAVLAAGAGLCWMLTGSWMRSSGGPTVQVVTPSAPASPQAPETMRRSAVEVIDEETAQPTVAEPVAWQPTFVPRSVWTNQSPGENFQPLSTITKLTVHHTGADTRALGLTDLQAVQRIEDYHRDERGWACIGYHFLIGHDGVVYEGRPSHMQGAHVRDANEGNIGISCIGAFDAVLPSEAQLASLQYLIEAIRSRAKLPTTAIYGHRDLSPSTCPGDAFYAWLQESYFGEAQG